MDLSSLPTSFGKQQSELPAKPSQDRSRGGHSGRGSRGVVGANQRGRGRGRGERDSGWQNHASRNTAENGSSDLHGGVKRPHPPSPNDTASNRNFPPNFRQNQQFTNRGGRGRGGGPRTQDHGGDRGFWKDSFIEDPWKQLEEQRAGKQSTLKV
ncbi:uncharacterized protein IL334_001223 [Kwoniella shivajii]|uniref:Cytoplasmic protein n=1 Tax=Kwoniella shivajii TaxID=564305 RepID=A0ABZ1CSF9_9TREE|nr:hypothetical protein IL334_001223 [Kwoniella shivajii]